MQKEKLLNFSQYENKVETNWYKFYENAQRHLDYPDVSIFEMLWNNSKNRLNLTAYNYFDNKATYKRLFDEIENCTKALKTIGVKENDTVTICMPNTPQAVALFYAINKIGAVASMIHPMSAENEIKHYLKVSDSKFLLAIDFSWERISRIIDKTNVEKIIIVSVK